MFNLCSKILLPVFTLFLFFHISILDCNAQCRIDFCDNAPVLKADAPVFDYETNTMLINNIIVGNFGCAEENYDARVVVYIYQLLPNGERITDCIVTSTPPDNFVANVSFNFGQVDLCDMSEFNLGTIPAKPENNFSACDGALYEVEIALYVTELPFDVFFSVYSQLPESQYIVENLGTIAVNYTDEFPTNADPITTASIKTYPGGETGTVELTCGETLQLDIEALSRLANCPEFEDLISGVPSELSNELYYSIDGGPKVVLQDISGGQLTGPREDTNLCYAGLLGIRAIEFSELDGIVDGSRVVFTVTTTDFFTQQKVQDEITIIYTGETCPTGQQTEGCTRMDACNYNANATIDDGSCLDDDCNGDCGGTATTGSLCDDGDATTANDMYDENCDCTGTQILGCTETGACNYNPEATVDDDSCRFESYYFNCNCEEPCPAGFNQDEQCNCISQCGPAPSAGEDTSISVCDNEEPFNLFDVLNGNPDPGGEWYFQSKADPLGAITDFIFTPGSSTDGVYLYFHFQGDECPISSATVTVTTNFAFNATQDASICEGETFTLPGGQTASTAGNYETTLLAINGCDSVILIILTNSPDDCEGNCGGSTVAGSSCDDNDPLTENDVYQEDCTCVGTPIQANCESKAGDLVLNSSGNFENGSYICFNETVQVEANNFNLQDGHSLHYIYHTETIGADGSFPIQSIIQFGNILTNELGQVTIYATAVAATDDGTGRPKLDDPCLVASNTLEINLLDQVSISIADNCDAQTLEYFFMFMIDGGLPAVITGQNYVVTGDYIGYAQNGESYSIGPLGSGGEYNISVTDENGCETSLLNQQYDCVKLPINLVSFTGEVQEDGDLIKWVSASEMNNDYYTLKHSADGQFFTDIATIKGAGTTSDTSEYEFFNTAVVEGFNYYKLFQTDFDSQISASGIIELNRVIQNIEEQVAASNSLTVYPVPSIDFLYVDINNYTNNSLAIYNAAGQKTNETMYQVSVSNRAIKIDTKQLAKGIYIINIVDNNQVKAAKFIKE